MSTESRKHIHQHLSFQERGDVDGYKHCTECGEKVVLISSPPCWSVDREAFKSGEYTRDNDDIPDEVDVGEEITAHYCVNCGIITSLSFNSL
jgi:hypothetical protein